MNTRLKHKITKEEIAKKKLQRVTSSTSNSQLNSPSSSSSDIEMNSNSSSSEDEMSISKSPITPNNSKSLNSQPYANPSNRKNSESSSEKSENEKFSHSEEEEDSNCEFLPCREQEQNTIYNYITRGLQTNGAYSSLYIAGMPGTGKTASVNAVINRLSYESEHKKISHFNHLYINGMKYTAPTNVLKTIYNFLFEKEKGQKNVKKYIQLLDSFFKNRDEYTHKPILNDPTNPHLILIIDEVDCLINQKQNLLYNIFNWTTYSKAKLIVISISNTLDLPSKLLPKISSRMGNNKLMFKPYLREELYKIISVRIEDVHLFSDDALKLSSMKVAAVNGDLRRILQICKRAKELFNLERQKDKSLKQITKKHIIKACTELFDSKVVKVIKSLQIGEKIILATILASVGSNYNNKIKVSDIYDKKDIFITKANEWLNEKSSGMEYSMNWEDFQMIIYNLVNLRIISFSESFQENFIDNTVFITFYTDEFMNAVEEEEEFKNVFDYLQSILNEK